MTVSPMPAEAATLTVLMLARVQYAAMVNSAPSLRPVMTVSPMPVVLATRTALHLVPGPRAVILRFVRNSSNAMTALRMLVVPAMRLFGTWNGSHVWRR